ncbi:Hypothetical predicted protein [Paramuricea clavata]|uniref:Uncharacterized protein n=1 Tax=Paramuricea clavata TaxID=317549 RepID=A0A6S7G2V9_PARCT|nr:Hypothetical predicted protein [Paramuricea clavata]
MVETNPSTAEPITNPVKTHVKDPRMVEAGRRLAKISQEAKARKRAQRKEAAKEEQNALDTENRSAGTVLIYIHTVEATEAKRKAIEAECKESEDRMLDTLETRFSLILEKKLKDENA